MARALIIGANSAIAIETARIFARDGYSLVLAGRNTERLATVAQDLRAHQAAHVDEIIFAAACETDYEKFAREVWGQGLDVLLIAHGSLPAQTATQDDVLATRNEFEVNALSTISLLAAFAGHFEEQGQGKIVVISSVASDRGRASNYVYGAAKAAVSTYCQGLRNRFGKSGIQVLTVKPGFVDTPMTAHLRKGVLWAQPEQIAQGIVRAMKSNRDIVYLPWFWRYIMQIIRFIPERIFKKLSL